MNKLFRMVLGKLSACREMEIIFEFSFGLGDKFVVFTNVRVKNGH